MSNSKRRNLLIAFCTLLCLCATVFCTYSIRHLQASADSGINDGPVFEMVNEALLRQDGDGLSFKVKMDEDTYNVVKRDDVELHFALIPQKNIAAFINYVDNGKFDNETLENYYLDITVEKSYFHKVDGLYYAKAGVESVVESHRKLNYVAWAYYFDGTDYVFANFYTNDGETLVEASTHSMSSQYTELNAIIFDVEDAAGLMTQYSWFGDVDYPILITDDANYSAMVGKVNNGLDLSSKSVVVSDGVETSAADFIDENNKPNLYAETYSITFVDVVIAQEEFAFGTKKSDIDALAVKQGYTFSGWKYLNANSEYVDLPSDWRLTGDITLKAVWTPNTDTPYTVNVYLENLDGTYALAQSTNLTGTTDAAINANAFAEGIPEGYEPDVDNPLNVLENTIAADGSATLEIYLKRVTFTVLWVSDGTTIETDSNVKYGATASYDGATPTKSATEYFEYIFANWDAEPAVVNDDITYTAMFDAKLLKNLTVADNGSSYFGTLDTDIDLNGYTLTYTSDRTAVSSLITTLNGTVSNGKIVVNSTNSGSYTANCSIIFGGGTGTVQDVEFDITVAGSADKIVVLFGFDPVSIAFEDCVIKTNVTDSRVSFIYAGNQANPNNHILSTWTNVISIGNIANFGFDIWNLGVTFAGKSIYGNTIYAENMAGLHHYASVAAYTAADYDTSSFDSNIWVINEYTNLPVYGEIVPIEIASASELKAISGVADYYILTDNITVVDDGSAALASLKGQLDLNGYTLTYNSDRTAVSSLITTLNGTIKNGKIVVNCTNASSGAIVFGNGSGKVKDVEFDITINGTVDGILVLFGFDPVSIAFEDCVIKTSVADTKVSFVYAGEQAMPNHHIASSWTNVIAIDNMANFGFDIYGLGVTFGGASISGNTIYVENMAGLHHYASVAAYTAANYNTSSFDTDIWAISKLTNLPSYGEIDGIEISTASELKAISGVSGNYYILMEDIAITDDGSAALASLDSILDLNGHTLTYTSSETAVSPLINTLNGIIGNGKIVVNSTNSGSYTAHCSIIFMGGAGTVQDVEFDITVAGSADNIVALFGFEPAISFKDCVIKTNVSDSRVSLIYAGTQGYENHTIESKWVNVISIGNIANFAYDIWGTGVRFDGTRIAGGYLNASNMAGLHHYASVAAYTAADYDTSSFNTDIWTIDTETNLPELKKK